MSNGASSTLGAASDAAGTLDPSSQVPLSLGVSVQPERYTFGLSVPIGLGLPPVPDIQAGIPQTPLGGSRSADPRRAASGQSNQARRSGVPLFGERRFIANEVMVRLPSGYSAQALDALARRHNLGRVQSLAVGLAGTTLHRWRFFDGRSVPDVIRALESDANVLAAQPNYVFTLAEQVQARAELESEQYALEKLHVLQAHRFSTGRNALVAVIDSGIDESHAEIAGLVAARFNAVDAGGPPDLHGTGMAGAIVAHARLKGIAPSARILAVRAFGSAGAQSGTTASILRGLDWAVTHHARIINMSFAGPYDPEIARALAAAHQSGVVLVAAAGNAGPKSPPQYPAADPNVIAVTATDADDRLFPMANRGRYVAVSAPGVDILTAAPGGAYQMTTGTSVAAAQVSGVAALLLGRVPALRPETVKQVLMSSSADLGPRGRDDQFGAGLTDAYRALQSITAMAPGPMAGGASPQR
jgi:subtilisin family serine protease